MNSLNFFPSLEVNSIELVICCKLLLASGIKEIKYIEDYKNDDLVKVYCEQLKIKNIQM